MIDEIHEHRDTERVREQDEFLAPVAADLPDIGEKANAGHPFGLRE